MRFGTIISLLLLLAFLQPAAAQLTTSGQEKTYSETPPRFKQGIQALVKILKDSIRYPVTAILDGVGGTVEVGFVLDTSGNIRDVYISKSVRDDIDQEAARVLQFISTGWEPGIQNDKKVEVKFHMPIQFSPPTGKHKKRYLRKHYPGYLNR